MNRQKLIEIVKVIGSDNPTIASKLLAKEPNKPIIGNVEFIYVGPKSGHQYITADGAIDVQFWTKGQFINKVFLTYEDALYSFKDVTANITIHYPNPRIHTVAHIEDRLQRLMIHFKEQQSIKAVAKKTVPYQGLNITHPMRIHIDKKVGEASFDKDIALGKSSVEGVFKVKVAMKKIGRSKYIEVDIRGTKYGYVADRRFKGGIEKLFTKFKTIMDTTYHGIALQWLKDNAVPVGKMTQSTLIVGARPRKYPLEFIQKLDIDKLTPEQGEDILKYFRGASKVFQSSPDYYAIYPYLDKIKQKVVRMHGNSGDAARKRMGIEYGDKVYYDHIDLFSGSNRLEGEVTKWHNMPYVKITKGKTTTGHKSVQWHKGWRKIET